MMKKIKKSLALAALALVTAGSLLVFKPVRAWASQEGTYYWNYLYLKFIATANRRTCNAANEGGIYYDSTIHSIAYCDGTYWHKNVSGNGAVSDFWTTF